MIDETPKLQETLRAPGVLMFLPKPLAVPLGLTVGLSYTLAASLVGVASAATPWPWKTAPIDWGHVLYYWMYRPIMGVGIQQTGVVEPVAPGEFAVCIANHPSTYGNSQFTHVLGTSVSSSATFVAKDDLEWIMRAPSNALGLALPINRNDRVSARQSVLKRMPELTRRSGVLVIFPDTTRPTEAKRLAAREKWIGRIPDFDEWSTLPPRSGALFATLGALPRPVRVFNITHAFNRLDESWASAANLYGAAYHAHIETCMSDELPGNEPDLQMWLNERWREKNRRIAAWRSITMR